MKSEEEKRKNVKALIKVEKIKYFKNNWGIIDFSVVKNIEGKIDKNATIAKGEMCKVSIGFEYYMTAEKVTDPKWGDQYDIKSLVANVKIDSKDGKRKYLESLFTISQVVHMYDVLDEPFDVLFSKSAVDLCKVKGCGLKTATKWIERFHDQYDKSRLYIELSEYSLSESMMNKLLKKYSSVDLIIDKVKANPYRLADEVEGIGFKTADEIALEGGIEQYSPIRIAAYIKYYLSTLGNEGQSYIASDELMDGIINYFGEDIPDAPIGESIKSLSNFLWYSDDHEFIGLKYYYDLESNIAEMLLNLKKAKTIPYSDWEEKIHRLEEEQGWCYDQEQYQGIKTVLDNNVTIITGLAGTGKSSIVAGVLKVLEGCSFSQCALAGKAAARLTEVTGEEGKTIHRLLGWKKGSFIFNETNPLKEDIIIVDEISMIDGPLFRSLLKAISPKTKLILLGDPGQLEAIGSCSIANDMILSGEIPVVYLTTIHRQAKESGIIVEAKKVYDGVQIVKKGFAGVETRGNLQDLILDCYSDKSNTYYRIMKYFSILLETIDDIMDLQIIVPMKSKGDACAWILNNAIQDLYNSHELNKKEIEVHYGPGRNGILRVGDKVINNQNNYKTYLYEEWVDDNGEKHYYDNTSEYTPVYNGNIGIIKLINLEENFAVIDFKTIGLIYLPLQNLKNIELAYAITTHKVQGSEFKFVIIGLDMNSYALLSKELVYTAITRAKKKCYLCVQTNALRYAIGNHSISKKRTFLQKRLQELAHPKLVF